MSHTELKELSISAYGHRHKLLRAAKLQVQGPQQTIIQGELTIPPMNRRHHFSLNLLFSYTQFLVTLYINVFQTKIMARGDITWVIQAKPKIKADDSNFLDQPIGLLLQITILFSDLKNIYCETNQMKKMVYFFAFFPFPFGLLT